MSRTGTADRLLRSAHQARTEDLAHQVDDLAEVRKGLEATLQEAALHQATTVDDLARRLLPVAQAMARLTEETRLALDQVAEATAEDRAAMARRHADQAAAAKAAADTLAAAMTQAQTTLTTACTALQEAAQRRQVNPWFPALVAAAMPLAAVIWLAWMVGALRL